MRMVTNIDKAPNGYSSVVDNLPIHYSLRAKIFIKAEMIDYSMPICRYSILTLDDYDLRDKYLVYSKTFILPIALFLFLPLEERSKIIYDKICVFLIIIRYKEYLLRLILLKFLFYNRLLF
jgi:hypothetical protein